MVDKAARRTPRRDPLAEKLKRKEDAIHRRHPKANPLADVEPTGNAEVDSKQYHEAYQSSFKDRMNAEAERMRLAIDAEYYCVLVFQTQAQKLAFVEQTGWDAYSDKYLDGYYVAQKMGVDLEASPELAQVPKYNISSKVDKKLAELVRDEFKDI